MSVPPLRLIALEVTRTCTLNCRHCRGDSRNISYEHELRLDEIKSIFDNTTTFAKPIIIITGGEPLTRPDIFDITAYSTSLGFRTVLATCGHLLTDDIVQRLIETGVKRISVSIDGANAEAHDGFRRVPGAFNGAIRGLDIARRHGLEFQINSTITTLNAGELDALHGLAVDLGAVAFHPFLLVPMGRGSGLADFALEPEEYERTLEHIADIASISPIEIKPTCSPHYARVARTRGLTGENAPRIGDPGSGNNRHAGHPGRHVVTKGCLGGQGFVFISHTGKVQMCGFMEIEAGDLRTAGYDLHHIWDKSEFFNRIRDISQYNGKCGVCEYAGVCGGCRARAYYMTGDYLGAEPNCVYIPKRMRT